MTKAEIIAFNERYALEKIRAAYSEGGSTEAMQLVHNYMGIDDMRAAYNKVMEVAGKEARIE